MISSGVLDLVVKYVFITPWCPADKLEWYKIIILLTHISGIASNAVSFSGIITNLNSNESNSVYLCANISTFCIADLVLSSLFCARYKYKSLKYGWLNILSIFYSHR